jgi:hypothetical protein
MPSQSTPFLDSNIEQSPPVFDIEWLKGEGNYVVATPGSIPYEFYHMKTQPTPPL